MHIHTLEETNDLFCLKEKEKHLKNKQIFLYLQSSEEINSLALKHQSGNKVFMKNTLLNDFILND